MSYDRSSRQMRASSDDLADLVQPAVQKSVVGLGEAESGIDSVEQGVAWVVGSRSAAIRVGDLLIDPDEGTARCPLDQGTGLPVHALPLIPLVQDGSLRPGDHLKVRQPDTRT